MAFGSLRKNTQWKAHRESPRIAAFRSVTHSYLLGWHLSAQN
jgi:hypothetical protein